ncbi:MAG TPA: HEAT repeat domain-containing protein [Pirellulaceae bacterium]|nr:HEAT repeat domain-containing protein [Pirellulaceae bacterium]
MPAPLHRVIAAWLLAAGLLLSAPPPLSADVFKLASGGQIEGEWINRDEKPATKYLVKTASGLTVRLQLDQVSEHLRPSAAHREYERLAPTFPDTVAGHWSLALWCRQQGLSDLRRKHLTRIIELDPNHRQARSLLGYGFIGGKWVELAAHKRDQGLELYRKQWRTPQEIELLEQDNKRELLEKEWLAKLQRWRKMLDSDKARTAQQSIRAIQDPVAVKPIGELFKRERVRSVKNLYADVLANIRTGDAIQFLIHATLNDPDIEVFYYCLDRLVTIQVPHLAEEYIDALRDPSNERVNRAAVALARLGDRSAISPLIDALITFHRRVLPGRPGMGPDATAATFTPDGSSFVQNEGPKVQIVRVQNRQVLDALSQLSGGSGFGFDQKAWRYWYHQERQSEARQGTSTLSRREE